MLKIGNAMLGINIERGAHVIEFKFEAPGLKLGIAISVFTLAVLIILMWLIRRRKNSEKKPMLPPYPKMGMRYSTEVFLPENKKKVAPIIPKIEIIDFKDVYSSTRRLPEREIIKPPKEIQREIISPESK